MDPNATLDIILDRADSVIAYTNEVDCDGDEQMENALELAEAVMNLHEWLSKGGFLPRQWEREKK